MSLPKEAFLIDEEGYLAPSSDKKEVKIDPNSQRLQLLQPFKAPERKEFQRHSYSL